jgi:signal transduction histidine kinase
MAGHTILVVDDEPASLRAVARALAGEHRIITATTGAQGLAALATEPVALLIADQRMPEMTGTELLALTATEQPEIIRVLLTGYTDVETLLAAINAGHVYYYLTKPWEPSELRLVVRRGLERHDGDAEQRRLLQELEQACARARREADQKGRLLTLAAHELGTPLHVLSNALALMADADLPADARSWLNTAGRSTDWLGRALAQMTTAARWRAGSVKLHCRRLDVRALLDDVRAAFEPVVASRTLKLRFEGACPLPPVDADSVWLSRALSNVIANAVRFTPDGGCITVAAAASATAVEVTVADTGIGIDTDLLDEVFEPFSAACGDPSLHTSGRFEFRARGLGLGLAIAKAIMAQHGGTISVCSQSGVGSRFTLTLPSVQPDVSHGELG